VRTVSSRACRECIAEGVAKRRLSVSIIEPFATGGLAVGIVLVPFATVVRAFAKVVVPFATVIVAFATVVVEHVIWTWARAAIARMLGGAGAAGDFPGTGRAPPVAVGARGAISRAPRSLLSKISDRVDYPI
jgi:hypothetical protein